MIGTEQGAVETFVDPTVGEPELWCRPSVFRLRPSPMDSDIDANETRVQRASTAGPAPSMQERSQGFIAGGEMRASPLSCRAGNIHGEQAKGLFSDMAIGSCPWQSNYAWRQVRREVVF